MRKNKTKTTLSKKKELMETGSVLSSDYSHKNKTREIIQWFKEGLTTDEVYLKILQNNPNLKESSAKTYLNSAMASFKEEYNIERKFVIIQHVKRYDRDINILAKHEPKTSSYAKYQFEKSKAYADMIDLLQKKEKVLGFHKKSAQIKIKNTVNIAVSKVNKSFDFSDLTFEEKRQMYKYIEKSFVNPNDKLVLRPNPNKQMRLVEDIEDVEIIEEESPIDLIGEKPDETNLFPVEEVKISRDKNIIDATNMTPNSSQRLEDIKNKMLNKLLS